MGDSQLYSRATRARNATLAFGQCGLDGLSFILGKCFLFLPEDASARDRPSGHSVRLALQPRLVNGESLPVAQDYGTLNYILQFANIPRPIVGLKEIQGPLVDLCDLLPSSLGVAFDQILNQHRDIIRPLAQCGYLNGENIKPIEKILTKRTRNHSCFQITICGS